jgi:prolyl oligopeptidase
MVVVVVVVVMCLLFSFSFVVYDFVWWPFSSFVSYLTHFDFDFDFHLLFIQKGGLMVGNLITRPISSKLFGAAVCQVPLLDMKVYSHLLAGNSWMAEYGNPDKPEEWKFLRRHSPYHLLRHDNLGLPEEVVEVNDDGKEMKTTTTTIESIITNPDWVCPKVLFTTSTRDDRVHPGHARKMVRSLLEEAQTVGKAPEVHYWENIEGGHGGAADNKQRAHMWSLTYSMLKQTLGL